jgi:hypothetical protein
MCLNISLRRLYQVLLLVGDTHTTDESSKTYRNASSPILQGDKMMHEQPQLTCRTKNTVGNPGMTF